MHNICSNVLILQRAYKIHIVEHFLANEHIKSTYNVHVDSSYLQMSGADQHEDAEVNSVIETSKATYGTPIWQMFYLLMAEEDEQTFHSMVEVLRETLKSYGQSKMLKYLEEKYLTKDRIKQWCRWFRKTMFNCEWKLNTNMHVESWHNFLKSVIMGRLKNVRIDKLIRILVQAALVYSWKWARTLAGCVTKRIDPAWFDMHGHPYTEEHTHESVSASTGGKPTQVSAPSRPEVKRTSYTEDILQRIADLRIAVKTRKLPLARQKAVLKQLTGAVNVYRTESAYADNVVTRPVSFVKTADAKCKVMSPVVNQYARFTRKASRVTHVRTNVKAFRESESNRHNHFQSFQLGCGKNMHVATNTELKWLRLTLNVTKYRKNITLGGITFTPGIAGIVVGTAVGVDALHVKVMKVFQGVYNEHI